MKKILVLLLTLVLSLLFVACGEQPTKMDMLKNSVEREDLALIVGEDDDVRIEMITYSEKCVQSSKSEELNTPKTLVKLSPKVVKGALGEYKVVLKNEDSSRTQELKLTKDVLGMTFSTSISSDIIDFKVVSIDILDDKDAHNIVMKDVLEGAKLSSKDALRVGYAELQETVDEFFDENGYNGTCVVKLIHNARVPASPYYYYVSFVRDKEQYTSCLIDPMTGQIISKKK